MAWRAREVLGRGVDDAADQLLLQLISVQNQITWKTTPQRSESDVKLFNWAEIFRGITNATETRGIVGLVLDQRRRRWANSKPILDKRLLEAYCKHYQLS